jgi:hypothetical protein
MNTRAENPSDHPTQASAMSRLVGAQEDRWSLSRAIDALGDAAKQAGSPGLIWLAGVLYPSLSLGLEMSARHSIETSPIAHLASTAWSFLRAEPVESGRIPLPAVLLLWMVSLLSIGLLCWPFYRMVAGLARIAHPPAWEAASGGKSRPELKATWRAGKGLTLAAFGLWIQMLLLLGVALVAFSIPLTVLVSSFDLSTGDTGDLFVLGAMLGPLIAILLTYMMVLAVLLQLALHSLVHNRRGVGSALIHAWRIARNDPWATARTILVDLVLMLSILALWKLLQGPFDALPTTLGTILNWFLQLPLLGFAGVTRAGYWARAYRALGGLSPEDGVPGL